MTKVDLITKLFLHKTRANIKEHIDVKQRD